MTTDGFAQWQITRQLASLMMELWCWRYGMKIGGLTGKVDKVYWYPALEWEMSLVAGKAVNQINSSYYSVPQKCPCVRLFCQVFNSDNFLMVPSRAHVRRWSFTLIQGVSKKTEFSGKQPWQIQLLWVGNTVGFFYKSRLCCFLTTSFPGRCVNNICT